MPKTLSGAWISHDVPDTIEVALQRFTDHLEENTTWKPTTRHAYVTALRSMLASVVGLPPLHVSDETVLHALHTYHATRSPGRRQQLAAAYKQFRFWFERKYKIVFPLDPQSTVHGGVGARPHARRACEATPEVFEAVVRVVGVEHQHFRADWILKICWEQFVVEPDGRWLMPHPKRGTTVGIPQGTKGYDALLALYDYATRNRTIPARGAVLPAVPGADPPVPVSLDRFRKEMRDARKRVYEQDELARIEAARALGPAPVPMPAPATTPPSGTPEVFSDFEGKPREGQGGSEVQGGRVGEGVGGVPDAPPSLLGVPPGVPLDVQVPQLRVGEAPVEDAAGPGEVPRGPVEGVAPLVEQVPVDGVFAEQRVQELQDDAFAKLGAADDVGEGRPVVPDGLKNRDSLL